MNTDKEYIDRLRWNNTKMKDTINTLEENLKMANTVNQELRFKNEALNNLALRTKIFDSWGNVNTKQYQELVDEIELLRSDLNALTENFELAVEVNQGLRTKIAEMETNLGNDIASALKASNNLNQTLQAKVTKLEAVNADLNIAIENRGYTDEDQYRWEMARENAGLRLEIKELRRLRNTNITQETA